MNACVFNTTRQFLQKKYLPRAKMPIPNITYRASCQAGRPAEAQLGKNGKNNLVPGCWENCLEWPISRRFRNRIQTSPDQMGRLVLLHWSETFKISGYTWYTKT
ncbi:hypothetical protein T10_608 [Trichinella papuae]|uniref:Uncharacterized protein n=1 Tax=Trichinella papuae TaxID=268474 RepID=A0A0V1MAF7_9BILA|nr:hypothetical protein T10_608 [Trichinella papuae]